MIADHEIQRRDDALEAQLKGIIAKPELAEEAFPDKAMAGKIVPSFSTSGSSVKNQNELATTSSLGENLKLHVHVQFFLYFDEARTCGPWISWDDPRVCSRDGAASLR